MWVGIWKVTRIWFIFIYIWIAFTISQGNWITKNSDQSKEINDTILVKLYISYIYIYVTDTFNIVISIPVNFHVSLYRRYEKNSKIYCVSVRNRLITPVREGLQIWGAPLGQRGMASNGSQSFLVRAVTGLIHK